MYRFLNIFIIIILFSFNADLISSWNTDFKARYFDEMYVRNGIVNENINTRYFQQYNDDGIVEEGNVIDDHFKTTPTLGTYKSTNRKDSFLTFNFNRNVINNLPQKLLTSVGADTENLNVSLAIDQKPAILNDNDTANRYFKLNAHEYLHEDGTARGQSLRTQTLTRFYRLLPNFTLKEVASKNIDNGRSMGVHSHDRAFARNFNHMNFSFYD